jgi:hypothetical protein
LGKPGWHLRQPRPPALCDLDLIAVRRERPGSVFSVINLLSFCLSLAVVGLTRPPAAALHPRLKQKTPLTFGKQGGGNRNRIFYSLLTSVLRELDFATSQLIRSPQRYDMTWDGIV